MRIHLPGLFHTVCNDEYSHCAFTGKIHRFARMMRGIGHDVIEYGNAGSTSDATEHVQMLSHSEFAKLYKPLGPTEQHARDAVMGSDGHKLFEGRLIEALKQRVKPLDIIAHPFGKTHARLLHMFKQQIHVETGVGYNDPPFGAFRIFESEAWRHYHFGRAENMRNPWDGSMFFQNEPGLARNYSWVIPNYYDPKDWPLGQGDGNYCLFMGRIESCKGIEVMKVLIEAWHKMHPLDGLKFKFAGQGDFPKWLETVDENVRHRIEYLGTVTGSARAELVGKARCMLMPSQYVEPFGGAGVEGMLTGTPLIASDYGAFVETVLHGVTGYRCKTLGDWLEAIRLAPRLQRGLIALEAADRYALPVCGAKYDRAFRQLVELWHRGWHSLESVNVQA